MSLCCLGLACADAETGGGQEGSTGTNVEGSAGDASTGDTAASTTESTTDSADASTGQVADTTTGPGETTDDPSTTADPDTGGSESSGTTGPALPRGQWAITEITYTEGGMSETLTMQDRTFCDATLDGGILLLRYQQQQGYTVWTVNMPQGIGVGSHALTQDFSGVYMNINEVGAAWMAYFDPAMAFGTLELTDADLQPGGTVAGTLTATLTSNDGTTTAEFESTFYAEIP